MQTTIVLDPIKQPKRKRDAITAQRLGITVDGTPVFGPQEVPLDFASAEAPHIVTGLKAGQTVEVRRAVTDRSGIWSDDAVSTYVVEAPPLPADTEAPPPPPGATFSTALEAGEEESEEG